MAELAKPGATILVERSGTRLVEHAAPAAPAIVDYPNELAALTIFRKRITELVTDGWQLSRADADIGGPIAVDPRVEAELRERLDAEQLAVYNDWLIEHGDPCGEYAALRGQDAPYAEFMAERGYDIFGCYHDLFTAMPKHRPTVSPIWMHGWITGFRLERVRLGTLLGFALQAPMARFVRSLEISSDNHAPTLRYALARSPHRTAIRHLQILDPSSAQHLLEVLPEVRAIAVEAGPFLSGHPKTEEVTLRVLRGRRNALFSGSWPALARLHVVARGALPRDLAMAIEATPFEKFPALKHVDLDVEPPVDAPTLARIRTRLKSFTT